MEEEVDSGPIMSLPYELVGIILQNVKCRDIINFGSTCKRFNEMVNSNQLIWKQKVREILPTEIADVIEQHGSGDWLQEIKDFFYVKSQVYNELMDMSPKYFCRTSEVALEDVRNFFDLALLRNMNYSYVIFVLQEIIIKVDSNIEEIQFEKPFNMTDIYYAKIVLRYLTQTFLSVKWMLFHIRNELTPDIVLNFFMQWTDPINVHSDHQVKACIQNLVDKVEEKLSNNLDPKVKGKTIQEKLNAKMITEKDVLEAVSAIIYGEHHIKVMAGASLSGLDIPKVLQSRCGNLIVAAVVYQAVARNCGVYCELIAFSNHLFLEWRPATNIRAFKIDLETGALVPQGRCPFAPVTFREEYKYSPDAFIQYVVAAYMMTMGAIKNWYTDNAMLLLDFFRDSIGDDNPYRSFATTLVSLLDNERLQQLDYPVHLDYINDAHLEVLAFLAHLNDSPTQYTREIKVKHHSPEVKFAVGMLAYHKKYDYLCVVRGWDLKYTTDWRQRIELKDLHFGANQPFYSVIAVDLSERYVAQENLIHVDSPTRLTHLEDTIAKEFSHFDGFCYMPNCEKNNEYPDDEVIRSVHRCRAEQRARDKREAI